MEFCAEFFVCKYACGVSRCYLRPTQALLTLKQQIKCFSSKITLLVYTFSLEDCQYTYI